MIKIMKFSERPWLLPVLHYPSNLLAIFLLLDAFLSRSAPSESPSTFSDHPVYYSFLSDLLADQRPAAMREGIGAKPLERC